MSLQSVKVGSMRVTSKSIQQLDRDKPRGKCRRWRLFLRVEGMDKRPSKQFTGTYTEAKEALEAFADEYEQLPPPGGNLGSYALKWLDWRIKSDDFAPGTIQNNRRELNMLKRSALWDMELTKIKPSDCRDSLTWIKANPQRAKGQLSNTTMNKLYITLGAILGQAWEDGLIAANPMSRIKAPRPDTKEKEAMTPEELNAFLDKVDTLPLDGRAMALYFMACLGLRRGEACALYCSDIQDGVCHVSKSVKDRNGKIGAPKSPSGVRSLPMPERLQNKVSDWLSLPDFVELESPTICCNTYGDVMRPQLLQRWWSGDATHNGISKELGYEGLTLHQLRHSNLSMMARYMSPFDLKTYAGWSSIEPAKVYIHDDLDSLSNAIDDAWS